MSAYDDDNIFAKIMRGEIPCVKVYEDDKVFAFMDIMPRSDGHTLVIPKAKARNLLDISPDDLADLMTAVQKIAKAAMAGMGADGITLQQFSEAAGGQEVFHIHFHVVPRWSDVRMRPPASAMADVEDLKKHAEKINTAL